MTYQKAEYYLLGVTFALGMTRLGFALRPTTLLIPLAVWLPLLVTLAKLSCQVPWARLTEPWLEARCCW